MSISKEDKKVLINLICKEQVITPINASNTFFVVLIILILFILCE